MSTERSEAGQYRDSWERYWSMTQDDGQAPLWDSGLSEDYDRDLVSFRPWVNPDLPVVDFGCGNGTQTVRLAADFPRVIGTDVSPAAIEIARQQASGNNVEYAVLDAFDQQSIEEFHARHGDVNVYLRGVFHQITPEDRAEFANALKTLLGDRGVLFLVEPGQESEDRMRAVRAAGPWPALDKVLSLGIQPGNVGPDELLDLLGRDRFEIVAQGKSMQHTAEISPGERVQLPAYYLVIAPDVDR